MRDDWPRLIRPGSRVFIGGGASVPFALVASMLEGGSGFKDVELVHIHGLGETPWIDPKYEQVLRTNSFFLTPSLREAVERGQADYTPCPMSEVASLFENGPLPLDVALIQVSPPDADGWCSLGVSVDVVKSAARCARVVIAQINPKMPRTCGDSRISVRKIDYFMEHSAALPEAPRSVLDERHARIGRYAAQLIEDGSTIQMGLGNSPEAVVRALKKHRHLGIHSGLFGDALMDLVRCGAVDSSRKNYRPGKIIASHVMGGRKLYQFVDGNPDIELHPSDWVNDPHRIARNDRMVAINGAREIDLTGQVVRDSSGHRFYGGIGALQDFIRGAGRSKGGRPIIALTSTADEDGRSRIVAGLGGRQRRLHRPRRRALRGDGVRRGESAWPQHPGTGGAPGGDRASGSPGRRCWPERGCAAGCRSFSRCRPPSREFPRTAWRAPGCVFKRRVSCCGRCIRATCGPCRSSSIRTMRKRCGCVTATTGTACPASPPTSSRRWTSARISRWGSSRKSTGGRSCGRSGAIISMRMAKRAEVAFVVHEKHRHAGMAGYLLGELAAIAKRRGRFHASGRACCRTTARWRDYSLRRAARKRMLHWMKSGAFEMPVEKILRSRKKFLEKKNIQRLRPMSAEIRKVGIHFDAGL